MNHTTNYQLSQWERTDQVKMEDFNADNAKLDAALKAEADARTAETSALTEAVAKLGNCQIYTTTYVGSGGSGPSYPNSLTFPKAPSLVVILGHTYIAMVAQGETILHVMPHSSYTPTVTWSNGGKTMYWRLSSDSRPYAQMNENVPYYVTAFYSADS